jgi:hypothetical protein
MAWQAPPSSTCKFDNLTRIMKQEGNEHLKGQTRVGFATPLYGPILQLRIGSLIS